MSIGGSESFGFSRQKSSDDSRDLGANVWGPQQQYLQDLYARAQQQSYAPTSGLEALQQGNAALQQGMGYMGQGVGQLGNAYQGMNAMANMQPGAMNPQLQAYANQVGQQFNEQIMPQLRGQAATAGQLGSSRAGLAQAAAGAMAQRSIQDFAGEQYQQDMTRQLQALQGMQAGGVALGQLGAMMPAYSQQYGQQAQLEAMAPYLNLQQYSALLGAPVMQDLGGFQQVRSSGWSHNRAMSGNFSMGMGGG